MTTVLCTFQMEKNVEEDEVDTPQARMLGSPAQLEAGH